MENVLYDVRLSHVEGDFNLMDLKELSYDCLMARFKELAVGSHSVDDRRLVCASNIFRAMCKAADNSRYGLLLKCEASSPYGFDGYLYRKPATLDGVSMYAWDGMVSHKLKGIRAFMNNSNGQTAVLGISGGKDSTVSAAMLVKALGAENVVGVFMPNQPADEADLTDSMRAAKAAGLTRTMTVNIREAYDSLLSNLLPVAQNSQVTCNLPPRLRMASLYMVAQSLPGGRVINNTNADEATVGYGTLWGDLAGDLAVLSGMSVRQVIATGLLLGLPLELLEIPPADGLTMKTDEEVLGFSYRDVETYRYESAHGDKLLQSKLDPAVGFKIHQVHSRNGFKDSMLRIPSPNMFRL